MKKLNLPILALIIANLIWGAASPIFKFALGNIPPFSLAFIRFLIASCLLYPIVHKELTYGQLKNRWLWLFAFSGITINITFFFLGLERTASINSPIIASAGPVILLIGSALFLRERIKKSALAGTLLSFTGIFIIVFQPILQNGPQGEIIGNFFLIIATLGYVVSTIAGRKFLTNENTLGSTFWSFLIGTLTFLPFMIWEFESSPGWIAALDYRGWTGIIFGSVFSSAIAYAAYDWALSKLPAYKTGVFTYLDPITAVAIAIPLLGEQLTVPFLTGSALVFFGILIAERRIPWHPLHKIFNL